MSGSSGSYGASHLVGQETRGDSSGPNRGIVIEENAVLNKDEGVISYSGKKVGQLVATSAGGDKRNGKQGKT